MLREPDDEYGSERREFARVMFDVALERRRAAEAACAERFLTEGHDGHAHDCVFGPGDACSRTYNPYPNADARPEPESDYEGTGIGVLYGLTPADGSDRARRMHVSLAGWTIARGPAESTVMQDVTVRPPRAEKHEPGPPIVVTTYGLRS